MSRLPIKIGVTGSIGTGKTTIVQEFAKHNILTWDSDHTVHQLYKKGNRGYDIVKKFVPEAAKSDCISREILFKSILGNPVILTELEKSIHPLVEMERSRFIKKNNYEPLIVLDIPLLFETSCDTWLDYIIVATVPFSIQKKRVLARKSMTEEKFLYLLSKQRNIEEIKMKANFVLNTDISVIQLSAKIKKILKEILHHYD